MKKIIVKVLCASLASTLVSTAFADQAYKPAMFGFSGKQLAEKITNVTSSIGDSLVLYCQSEISAQGAVQNTSCYDKQGNDDVVAATEQSLKTLSFEPAQVDGKSVPVRMSYRLGLTNENGDLDALLIPNLGTMHERYGRDYVAPQERLDVSDWYGRYNKSSWVNGEAFLGDGPMSRVAATIDEKGKTDIVRTLDTERAYKRDAKIVKNALKKSRFIPGFVDGKAVPMGYLAVVNYGAESGEAVSSR